MAHPFQQSRHPHSDHWQRTIYTDTLGVGTTDFDISDEREDALIRSGWEGTRRYCDEGYNDPGQRVVNRP